jgi:hypothetical protein
VPALLKCVLKDERWRKRRIKTGDEVPFMRFEEFVTAKPLEGLGVEMGLIDRIVADDPEAVELLKCALVTSGPGGDKRSEKIILRSAKNDNRVHSSTDDAGYALRRLRDQRPELHARVLARELSPNAAMIEAGFRKPKVQVPLDPDAAVRLLVKHFRGDDLTRLVLGLANWAGIEVVSPSDPN